MDDTDKPHFITFITGKKPDSSHYWAYLAIPTENFTLYQAAAEYGDFNLEDYATVIAFGDGQQPPEDIKQTIYNKYKLDDEFEDNLLAVRILMDEIV